MLSVYSNFTQLYWDDFPSKQSGVDPKHSNATNYMYTDIN